MVRPKKSTAVSKPVLAGDVSSSNLYIPRLIQDSLAKRISTSTKFETDLLSLAVETATKADSLDYRLVEEIASFALFHLNGGQGIPPPDAILLLFHCATFYERTGQAQEGLALMKTTLTYATELKIVDLQRRCNNMLGIFYSRTCDFTNSCLHLEVAYNLANQMKNSFLVFSALANAVASLETMGLLHNARDLALRISRRFEDDRELDPLHIPNASNGIIISHLIGDVESASVFYNICIKSAETSISMVDDLTRAYFEAARATHLTAIGERSSALIFIDEALEWGLTRNNVRINAVLLGAQAEVRLAIGNSVAIEDSRAKLTLLLNDTTDQPWHHEDLLRTLFKLYSGQSVRRVPADRTKALKTLKRLREHMIAVKHGRFYARKSVKASDRLGDPSYPIPEWIQEAGRTNVDSRDSLPVPVDPAPFTRGKDDQLIIVSDAIAKLAGGKTEIRLQTPLYYTAESWAVAADFANGGDGRDCLRVGKLAALIASAAGFSKERCIATELACRLRNVGTVFVDRSSTDASEFQVCGRFSPAAEHAVFGEILLSSATDETLQLAAKIAKSHHEWWNGCGYPLGLAGPAIPLEGRICLIADVFISYVTPHQKGKPWPIDVAFHQVESMAGFQIDPSLVPLLRRVLEENFAFNHRNRPNILSSKEVLAKNRLLATLELSRVRS